MGDIQGVIFDLDGVIVDTAVHHFQAWQRLADQLGFSFTEKDNERLKGVSRMDSLNILLEIGGISKTEQEKLELAAQKNSEYVEAISQMTENEILPGIKAFLAELKEAGIPIAIGSASKNTPIILERIGLKDAFDTVVDGNVINKAKPDPEVFLTGARRLNIDPSHCVVFEDAQSGIEAAKNAGMYAVAVGDAAVLSGADDYVSSLEEVTLDRLKKVI
ncbi:beta-phosphoglucomutase [Salisediminibacterium halotolerans]|uniref:Beta-phosphoglucomutase n=1 Tax=Salisediminibacterium halotolerans TaxID=517425 RepID=A0A1H9WF76_9BACI|nr:MULTISPECIES: beta-phosphoglucomutase [Salisediminibacterium]RLJ77870.1 beta-phosphoglucomutase [Actinophytocola xinjiangensis]RPE88792.1 beta-phosphoglucomutase [Salisediminibacterium halotolerans]TWG36847.1 beta-phosphoglucomutase [Salisediminibacterium halotolerans]SES32578.1 beta-phosphoglucomutase [Salisediminibacterium haloalkalitolerans]GEL07984.1 beta-phosphoglucomutase [Salisediminibacterium halotolerans]